MIRIITACALFSLAAAAVIPDDAQAKIVSYHNENDGSGNYDFSFETSNGIGRQETGRLVNAGAENQYVDVQGSYFYTDADGKPVQVTYRADENGYHLSQPKPADCMYYTENECTSYGAVGGDFGNLQLNTRN